MTLEFYRKMVGKQDEAIASLLAKQQKKPNELKNGRHEVRVLANAITSFDKAIVAS